MAKKITRPSKPAPKSTPSATPGAFADGLMWVPVILAFLLFSLGLRNEMLGFDDHSATVDNPAVTGFELFRQNLGMYAPITWLGHGIAYLLGKDNPFPYHFLSLLVHVFNVWLVQRLVLRLSDRRMVAFWVALLFAIHPVQVESVAWIAGFSTPLYALFYLLACLWYLDYAEGSGNKSRAYSLALGAFVLACLSKSAAVTLPLVLVLLDWWAGRPVLDRRRLLGYAPFFAAAFLFGLLTIYVRNQSGLNMGAGNDFSILDRLLILAYTPVFYWYNLLIPLKLNIYYDFYKINGPFPWPYWVSPLVLLGGLFLAWRYRQKMRFVWFGLLFFFANLSVMLPFRAMGTFELCADHYNYLAAIGIFFALAQGLQALAGRYPNYAGALRALGGLWVAALVVLCILQIRVWKNTITVVTNAIDNGYHHNGRLYEARANAYGKKLGDKDRDKARAALAAAINDYTKALEINPELWDSYKYRGGLYGMKKQYEKSIEDLSKYLEQHPDDFEQSYNRGLSLLNMGHAPEAIKAFDRTLELNPKFLRAYRSRSNAYAAVGDTARADADLREFDRRQTEEGAVQ